MKKNIFMIGAVLMVFGGAGLAEISTSNHGSFWVCNILLSVGIGLVLLGYEKNE